MMNFLGLFETITKFVVSYLLSAMMAVVFADELKDNSRRKDD